MNGKSLQYNNYDVRNKTIYSLDKTYNKIKLLKYVYFEILTFY